MNDDKLYMIIGYTNTYGFSYGMYEYEFAWTQSSDLSLSHLRFQAVDLSYELIEDHESTFKEDYESEDDMFEQEIAADVYSVSPIVKTIEDGEELIDRIGIEDFINEYCEIV